MNEREERFREPLEATPGDGDSYSRANLPISEKQGFPWKEVLGVTVGGLTLTACAPSSGAVVPNKLASTAVTRSAREAGVPPRPTVLSTATPYKDNTECGPGEVYEKGSCNRPSPVRPRKRIGTERGGQGLFKKVPGGSPKKSLLSQEDSPLSREELKKKCGIHSVQPGETAWEIARANGLTLEQLAMLNGMTPDSLRLIYPNQPLVIDMEKALFGEACGTGGQGPEISPNQKQQIVQELGEKFNFKSALSTSCGILILTGGRQGVPWKIAQVLQRDLDELAEVKPGLCKLLVRMGARYVRGEPGIKAGRPEMTKVTSGVVIDFDNKRSILGSRGKPLTLQERGALLAIIIHEAGHLWQELDGRILNNGCVPGEGGRLVSREIDSWQLVRRMQGKLQGVLNEEAWRGMESLQLESLDYYQNTSPYSDYIDFCAGQNRN